jgi:hypothetical protein
VDRAWAVDGGKPLTRRGKRWTEGEDAELRRRVTAKQTTGQIAREMERTMDSIRTRATALRITLRSFYGRGGMA